MNYYKEKQLAYKMVSNIIDYLKENKKESTINHIVFEITNKFAVSEKAVKERIKLIETLEEDLLITEEDVIKWL